MKLNRISVLVAVVAGVMLAGSGNLRAQDAKEAPKDAAKEAPKGERRPGADFAKQRLDRMAEQLKLSDEQKTKVADALKAQAEKMRALAPEERREKMKTLRDDLQKQMKEILTAEQYEKWTTTRPQGRGPATPGGPAAEEKKKKSE